MPRLINYTDLSVDSLINILKSQYIVVYEDIQGSTIYVQYDGKSILVKPRSLQNEPLNQVDLAIQKYYGPVFEFFQNIDEHVKGLMPTTWWFEFEYFFDNQPAHIEYQVKPKNGLILTGVIKGKKRKFDLQEIIEYANLFGVDPLPTVFAGKLNDAQISALQTFMQTNPEDLDYIFKENNFSKYFYEILNPTVQHSVLMKEGEFQNNIEKLIIKIPKQQKEISFSILNPLYHKNEKNEENRTEFVETYSIILLNFLEYSQLVDLNAIKISGANNHELYLDVICKLFNNWMKWNEESFKNFEFVVPTFFHDDKFKVNIKLIKNATTRSFLVKNDKIEYAFRCILGSFQHIRKKPIGILNDTSLQLLNQMIIAIQKRIDHELDTVHSNMLQKKDLMNFDQFDQVKKNLDSEGQSYPDIYKEIESEKPAGGNKKKPMSKVSKTKTKL